ncbi:hypothetical protein FPRO04_10440 [Fusarium proliferatum]|nr:hypothetical protein FPRO04_10440 [Fusarium proliferatum]
MAPKKLPTFDELPLDKDGPPGNAWGLWGSDDQLGRLNLLTPETVRAAASEIREGIRISLDWPLDKLSHPPFGRQALEHRILNKAPMTMNDDVITLNTQSSTQWDGFRHYGYQRTGQFYMGHKQEEFVPGSQYLGIDGKPTNINQWEVLSYNLFTAYANNGGIIGRGVLIDWYSWSQRNNISLSPFQTNAVEMSHIRAIIAEENIEFCQGDILFIRVGFTAHYNALSPEAQENFPYRQPGGLLGLEATKESLRWLWDSGFSAIASDAAGFERGPATGAYNHPDVSIHQWALAGWGMPIGELFDLEELAEKCRERKRWSFFLTSVPLKVPGGVASPGNANSQSTQISELNDMLFSNKYTKAAPDKTQLFKDSIRISDHRVDILYLQDIPLSIRTTHFPDHILHILAFGPNKPELLPPKTDEQGKTRKRKATHITNQYLKKEKLHAVAYLIHKSIPVADWDVEFHDNVNIGLAATLLPRISDDQTISIHNIYNQQKNVKIPDLLQRVTATGEDFLVGDFNLHHPTWSGDNVTKIEPQAIELANGLDEAGMELLTTRGFRTYARGKHLTGEYSSTIDLTYASPSLIPFVRKWQSPDVPGFDSDHRVIMTTLNLEVNRVPSTYYIWKRADPDKFRACVGGSLKPIGFPALTTPAMVDNYARKVVQAFGPAIETLVPLAAPPGSKRAKSRPSLVTQRAQNLLRLSDEKERHAGVYTESQQHYKVKRFAQNVIRKERSASFHRMLSQDIAKRRRLYFWARRGASWNKKALMPIRQLKANNITHRTPDGMAGCFRQAMWPDGTSDEQQVPPDRPPPDDSDKVPFVASQDLEKSEVKSLITGAPSGKAAGPDLLAYEGMKMAHEELLPYLHHLFAACLKLGHHPAAFKQACTVMLRKGGKDDYEQPKSWRPVALLPCMGKLLEKIFTHRLKQLAFEHNLLPDVQFGTPGKCTTKALQYLLNNVYYSWTDKIRRLSTIMGLDITGAYDRVDRVKLMRILQETGLPEWMLSFIWSFLTDRITDMRLPDFTSSSFWVNMGIPQGSPLSPILFLFFSMPIPEASIRILGVEVDNKLNWQAHALGLGAKVNAKMNDIARICNTTAGPDMIALRQLYITTVRPIISHGCGAWFIYGEDKVKYQITKDLGRYLGSIQNQCLRIVTGALARTKGRAVNKEAYVEDILVYLDRVATVQRARALDTPDHERLRRIRRQGRTPAEFDLHPYHALDHAARYLLERANESCRDRSPNNVRKVMVKIVKQDSHEMSCKIWNRHVQERNNELSRFRSAADMDKAGWGPHNLKRYRGLSRAQSTMLIQCRTGYIALNKYLHWINAYESPLCDCGAADETVFHAFIQCEMLATARIELYTALGHRDFYQMLSEKPEIAADWAITHFEIPQFECAKHDSRFNSVESSAAASQPPNVLDELRAWIYGRAT